MFTLRCNCKWAIVEISRKCKHTCMHIYQNSPPPKGEVLRTVGPISPRRRAAVKNYPSFSFVTSAALSSKSAKPADLRLAAMNSEKKNFITSPLMNLLFSKLLWELGAVLQLYCCAGWTSGCCLNATDEKHIQALCHKKYGFYTQNTSHVWVLWVVKRGLNVTNNIPMNILLFFFYLWVL